MVATHRLALPAGHWSDHIYRHQPTLPREQKPLLSLWAQWYIGLLVPPLMLALLNEPQGLSLAPEHFHVEFHESGRAACFWIDVHSDADIERLSPQARMDARNAHPCSRLLRRWQRRAKSIANLSGAIPAI